MARWREGRDDEEEETIQTTEAEDDGSVLSVLPPVDYLLNKFDYNIDEDQIFGQQKEFPWPLFESIKTSCANVCCSDGEEMNENGQDTEAGTAEPNTEDWNKLWSDLPYTYVNLVKNISLVFTFGLASPLTAWIGGTGIICRWLALSFLAERFEQKRKARGEEEITTDAQGIPFRCIILVVIYNIGFFATALLLAGINVEGVWSTLLFLSIMGGSLVSYMVYLAKMDWDRGRGSKDLREPLLSLAGEEE